MLVSNIKVPVVSGSNQGSNNLTLKGWPLTVSLLVCLSFKSGLILLFFSPFLILFLANIYHSVLSVRLLMSFFLV